MVVGTDGRDGLFKLNERMAPTKHTSWSIETDCIHIVRNGVHLFCAHWCMELPCIGHMPRTRFNNTQAWRRPIETNSLEVKLCVACWSENFLLLWGHCPAWSVIYFVAVLIDWYCRIWFSFVDDSSKFIPWPFLCQFWRCSGLSFCVEHSRASLRFHL